MEAGCQVSITELCVHPFALQHALLPLPFILCPSPVFLSHDQSVQTQRISDTNHGSSWEPTTQILSSQPQLLIHYLLSASLVHRPSHPSQILVLGSEERCSSLLCSKGLTPLTPGQIKDCTTSKGGTEGEGGVSKNGQGNK